MLEGALILLAGVLVGRFMPGRRRRPKPLPPPKPICGCGHHRSFHSDGKACTKDVERYNSIKGTHWVECACGEYTGPEPAPSFYAPEIGA